MTSASGPLSRIWTIARRELKALIDHPTAYVLLVVFLGINAFLFFRQAYLTGVASMRPMIDLLPWVFLFFVPAVSMRTLAEDARSGMLEAVLTQPLTELELVAGKFAGAVLFVWISLALTLAMPVSLVFGAKLRLGTLIAQYVGAALLAASMTGIGVWASSLTRSQITAFILSVAVTFVFVLVGLDPLLVGLPPGPAAVAARLGVLSHFQAIGRGVIDLRDVLYFVSLAGVFLAFAYGALLGSRLARGGAARRRLRLGVAIIAASAAVVNLLGGFVGGRLDLSPGRVYTLSSPTKQIIRNLDDIVTFEEFASDELPTSASLVRGELEDMLRDVRSAGHGKVRVVRRNTTTDRTAQSDAQTLGIGPVQFNVYGASELQVKAGYLGIAIQYGGKHETIPFVDRTDDLEYRLASAIRSLTRRNKPVVAIVSDVAGSQNGYDALRAQLEKAFDVRSMALADSTQPPADAAAVIFPGAPVALPPGAADRMHAYFRRGGSALVLASGMQVNPREPMAAPNGSTLNPVLAPFGVSVRNDMVYDLAANEVVPASSSNGFQVLRQYPFFVRARTTGKSVVSQDLTNVLLPWASSIDTAHSAAWAVTPLLVTTDAGGVSTGETLIDPMREFPRTNLASRLLAVQVRPAKAADSSARGRVIVVGSSEFASSNFARHAPENLSFTLNAVDWLAQDEALIAIRAKDSRPPALAFTSAVTRDVVKYGNVIGMPALVGIAGALHLLRRRRRTRQPYHRASLKLSEAAA